MGIYGNLMEGHDQKPLIGDPERLSASEAVYGFAGWLTTRKEKIEIGVNEECGKVADLVDLFCRVNNLPEPCDGWAKKLHHPEE